MSTEKSSNPEIFKYFRKGDIVMDWPHSCWRDTRFVIYSFHGNDYLPLVSAYQLGKPETNGYMCNFDARLIRLVGAQRRPLRAVDKRVLGRMIKRGVVEARREMMMRINNKTL